MTEPASKIHVPVERAIERCTVYKNGRPVRGRFNHKEALEEVRSSGEGYVWISLNAPDQQQMVSLSETFGVHELIVEDAVYARQRPKVERYEDQLFMVIRSIAYQDIDEVVDTREVISTGEIQMIMGSDFIITIRHAAANVVKDLRRKVEEDPELNALGPAYIAWLVSDILVDSYLSISHELSTEVDELEETVFTPNNDFDIEDIYTLKREILEMRHAIDPLAPALKSLIHRQKDLLPEELRSYYRDVMDHELVAMDLTSQYDERLSSLINAAVAKVQIQQNSDMRKISAVFGLLAIPTAIAGIYGMNFDVMPELHYEYGYPAVLVVMLITIVVVYIYLRRNKWL
ncbi:MAG: magnesium/cobalt transporter CorA [Corynebacterium glucuronolyticum]|nr:magnesium/cobalt transporter CorA [Mycobacteriaceae bacterium]MDY5835027.1 magnesium/cobalt transporter CorA [Corynebacterium glucuronolyticum]